MHQLKGIKNTHIIHQKITLFLSITLLLLLNISTGFSNTNFDEISSPKNESKCLKENESNINPNDFIMTWDLSTEWGPINVINFQVETIGLLNYSWQEISPGSSSGSGSFSGSSFLLTGLPSGSVINLTIESTNLKRVDCSFSQYSYSLIDIK